MKSINLILAACGRCVLVTSMLVSASTYSIAGSLVPDQELVPFLRLAAEAARANVDRVQTWRGHYEMKRIHLKENPSFIVVDESASETSGSSREESQLEGQFIRTRKIVGDFVADLRGDRLFTSYRAVGDIVFDQQDGPKQLRAPQTPGTEYHQESILTSQDYTHIDKTSRFTRIVGFPELPEPPRGFRMVERQSPDVGHQMTRGSTVFDPRRLYESGGRKHYFILNTLARWVETKQVEVVGLVLDDGRYQIQYKYSDGEKTTKVLTQYGNEFLLTESRIENPQRGSFFDSWDYDLVDGIAIPVHHEFKRRDVDGTLQTGRTTSLLDMQINSPVTDDEFGVERLSPFPLDRMVDRINDTVELFVDGSTVVSADEFRSELLPAGTDFVDYTTPKLRPLRPGLPGAAGNGFRRFLLILNLGMIIAVACIFVWQRRRYSAGSHA